MRDAGSGVWRYGYDNVQNLTSVTDPLGRMTRYTPDVLGRVEKLTPPLGPERTFGYDGNGNLSWSVDAKGQRSDFTYDKEDRLTAKTITGPEGTLAWSYLRDPEGNPWSITQERGREGAVLDPRL